MEMEARGTWIITSPEVSTTDVTHGEARRAWMTKSKYSPTTPRAAVPRDADPRGALARSNVPRELPCLRASSLRERPMTLFFHGERYVKNAETRALTGLDVKPPTTIAAYVSRQSPRLGSTEEMCVCGGRGRERESGVLRPNRATRMYHREGPAPAPPGPPAAEGGAMRSRQR